MPTRLPLAAVLLVLAGVVALLLAPFKVDLPIAAVSSLLGPVADGGTPLWWAMEDSANVLLFAPVGLLLARALGPVPALAVGVAMSACCEAAQHALLPDRVGSLRDVAMNGIGTVVGVAVALIAARRVRRARSGELHLAASGAGPVQAPRIGLRDLHAVQAGRAVRHVEPGLVDLAADRGQREVLAVAGAAVALHPAMVAHPSDDGQVRA